LGLKRKAIYGFKKKDRRKCVAIVHCMKMKKAMVAATSRHELKQHPRVAKSNSSLLRGVGGG